MLNRQSKLTWHHIRLASAGVLSLALAACGGGGSNSGFFNTGAFGGVSNSISGVVSKGLVSGAQVCAYSVNGGVVASQIESCVTTDSSGHYTVNLGTYIGPVLLQATHGSYTDEASGQTVDLDTATATPASTAASRNNGLRSMVANSAGINQVAITALTEIAYQIANNQAGQLSVSNIQNAITSVQNNFGVTDIVQTMPVDGLSQTALAGAGTVAQRYNLALASVSQYLTAQAAATPGTTLATVFTTLQACLASPVAANCGSGSSSVGAQLSAAITTFRTNNPTLTSLTNLVLPVANFGKVTSAGTGGTGGTSTTGTPLSLLAGASVSALNNDGPGATALFAGTAGTATDSAGNIYVADTVNSTIRKITPAGVVSTLAGTPGVTSNSLEQAGTCSNPCYGDGVGNLATFSNPQAITYDSVTNKLYVADTGNLTIRMITLTGPDTGKVVTIAGLPHDYASGSSSAGYGMSDATTGLNGTLWGPNGVVADGAGNLYISDKPPGAGGYIRKLSLTPPYALSTVAGGGSIETTCSRNHRGNITYYACPSYFKNGSGIDISGILPTCPITPLTATNCLVSSGTAPGFVGNGGLSFDRTTGNPTSGNLLVADYGARSVRMVTPAGVVTTYAGATTLDGSAPTIPYTFDSVLDVAIDNSTGNLYVLGTNTIWQITPAGNITIVAGGASHPTDFTTLANITFDIGSGSLYVTDNNSVRKVSTSGIITTLAGGITLTGANDGYGSSARFNGPWGIATDSAGNVYVTDQVNETIRAIAPNGNVTTLAGAVGVYGFVDNSGTAANFNYPIGLAYDSSSGNASSGSLLVAENQNNAIRMVTLSGAVTTYAGLLPSDPNSPSNGGSTVFADGTGNNAAFYQPSGVAIDATGNAFVTDTSNNAIRKIAPGGVVTTIAGPLPTDGTVSGPSGFADGKGSAATFAGPTGIAVDASGNLYVADSSNNAIRKVTTNGTVSTFAGPLSTDQNAGQCGFADGTANGASFCNPQGLAIDSAGNLYVADAGNNAIRKVTPLGVVTTVAVATGMSGGLPVQLVNPNGVAIFGTTLYITSGTYLSGGVVYISIAP